VPDKDSYKKYKNSGFLQLQLAMAQYALQSTLGKPDAKLNFAFIPMATPAYYEDKMAPTMLNLYGLMFLFATFPAMMATVAFMVQEKEYKLKATMQMMGLRETPYVSSFFLMHMIISLITVVASTILLGFILRFSNVGLVFFFMLNYSLSMFGYAMLVVPFFTNQKNASLTASLLHFFTFIL